MPLLEAFLALALTMLSLGTIATIGVEMVNRVMNFRGNDLRRMLQIFYDNELQEVVNSKFGLRVTKTIDAKRDEVISGLIKNPMVRERTWWLGKWFRDLTHLSTEEMIKRLPSTAVGQALNAKSAEDVDRLLDNAITKYDHYGDAASQLFKRRAQFVSLIVGVIVAFSLNVDALYMFEIYLKDPDSRQAVIANAELITETWEKVSDDVDKRANEPVVKSGSQVADAPTGLEAFGDDPELGKIHRGILRKRAGKANEAAAAEDKAKKASATLDVIESDLSSIQKLATDLQNNTSVPLGYRHTAAPAMYFWSAPDGEGPPSEGADGQVAEPQVGRRKSQPAWGYFSLWVVRVLATGLLIGLGGPFWFNIVQMVMSVRGGGGGAPATPQAPPAPDPVDPVTKLKQTFLTIQKVERELKPAAASTTASAAANPAAAAPAPAAPAPVAPAPVAPAPAAPAPATPTDATETTDTKPAEDASDDTQGGAK